MSVRIDDAPAAHPLASTDNVLVDQSGQDPSFGTGRASLATIAAFVRDGGFTMAADLTTPSDAPTTILSVHIAAGYFFKARVEIIGVDPTGAGVGAGEIQLRATCFLGNIVGITTFGDVQSWSGSLVNLVAPTFANGGFGAGNLLVQVTGQNGVPVHWRAVVTVSPYRSVA